MARRALPLLPLVLGAVLFLGLYGLRSPAAVVVWAAERMTAGQFGPHVYDDPAVIAATRDILSPSPPTMPLLVMPLLPLNGDAREVAWTAGDLAALLGAAWLIRSRLPRLRAAPVAASVGLGAFILSAPMAVDAARGQLHLWMLLFLSVVFAWPGRDRLEAGARAAWYGAAGLALAFALKVAGWPLWLVMAVRGEWRTLRRFVFLTGVGLVATLPLIGLDTWVHYWTVLVPDWTARPEAGVTAFQTVAGFFQHLFRFEPNWNPEPWADVPVLAAALTLTVGGTLVTLTLIAARRASRNEAIAAGVLLVPMLSPVAEQYHYLVALIPLAVCLDAWLAARSLRSATLLIAAAWLLLWPLPFLDPDPFDGPIAVLGYPRLAGALLLWALIVVPVLKPTSSRLTEISSGPQPVAPRA